MAGRVDAVVVGGGPAGISAAHWLARYRRRTTLIDGGEPRNRWTEAIHGYLGSEAASPGELVERSRTDLKPYPEVDVRQGSVLDVEAETDGFVLSLEGEEIAARAVVLATGVVDVFPEVRGFETHYGASVFHCPACDGYEARGHRAVVFGWGPQITGFAETLLTWARSVTVVTNGPDLEVDRAERSRLEELGIAVLEEPAEELIGSRGDLRAVRLTGGGSVPCEIGFFTIGHRPRSDLARRLGCRLTPEDLIAVDENGGTTVPGVWAAGDITPGPQLVQIAAAEGTAAGIACATWLRSRSA
jgi:thioredoxin reductase